MKTLQSTSLHLAWIALAALASTITSAQAESEKVTAPRVHENLAVYLIQGPDRVSGKTYLTLQEALAQKKAVVRETGKVNQLTIENTSKNADIYIQAGDIVKGGQQDRTLGTDLILESKKKTPIAAFCVESGRWTRRGKEPVQQFTSTTDQVASKELKLAVKSSKEQGEVWKSVTETQSKLSGKVGTSVAAPQSASSLQLTLENKEVKATADSYITDLGKALEDAPDAIGFAFAINGKVSSVDTYGSHTLFKKMWPKLLKAAAVEAVANLEKGKTYEAPLSAEIEAAIATAETANPAEETLSKRVKAVTKDGKDSVLFETRDQDVSIHRNLVMK